jgi:hypothetical protein
MARRRRFPKEAMATAICVGLISIAAGGALAAPGVDEIIDECIRASGGYEALTAIKSVHRKGDIVMQALGQQIEGSTEIRMLPWRKLHEFTDLNLFAVERIWNGVDGWEDSAQGPRRLNPDELALLRLQSTLNPLVGHRMLRLMGGVITLEGDELLGERDHKVVQLSLDANSKIRFLIDAETNLLSRLALESRGPVLGISSVLSFDYADYETHGAIKLPRRISVSLGQLFSYKAVYTETKLDIETNERIFDPPKGMSAASPP